MLFLGFFCFVLFYQNGNVKNFSSSLNLMIELLISLPVSLCSCLLLSSPCLRIIDVLGCVCVRCVFVVKKRRRKNEEKACSWTLLYI